jgi:L-alanine-DL-glutamate epimerase-like enolase superfamily enzyme
MEGLGYAWLEAPLPDDDLIGYRELRRRFSTPILCSGNVLWRPAEVLSALEKSPWDAIHFDVSAVGGITAGRKLAVLAEAAGLPLELQSWVIL